MAERPGIEQKVLGQWECSIVGIVGDPKTDPEVHVHILGEDVARHYTVIVASPKFDPDIYAMGKKVLIEEWKGEQGSARYVMRDLPQRKGKAK